MGLWPCNFLFLIEKREKKTEGKKLNRKKKETDRIKKASARVSRLNAKTPLCSDLITRQAADTNILPHTHRQLTLVFKGWVWILRV
ncbi:hypothetical protein ACLB2K_063273 [Fragaria x ananassa]